MPAKVYKVLNMAAMYIFSTSKFQMARIKLKILTPL